MEYKYGKKTHTATVVSRTWSEDKGSTLKKLKLSQHQAPQNTGAFKDDDTPSEGLSCNTLKDKGKPLNYTTAGILAGAWPCGIIMLVSELFRSESKSQVYASLHQFFDDYPSVLDNLKYICYDDGCHLKKYAINPQRSQSTETANSVSQLSFVIDRMHMKGHVDSWCKKTCDPSLFPDISNVNTEICEQSFSWLSRYARITRHMNRTNFVFFVLYLCDLHNLREITKLKNADFL